MPLRPVGTDVFGKLADVVYAALLRGINVGGKNRVEMPRLRESFERLGFGDVRTYINSGNVIFGHGRAPDETAIEKALKSDFGFQIKVVVRDRKNIEAVVEALPDHWVNDATMKCDVMFLWAHVDSPDVLDHVTVKPGIDDVNYVPGALLWRVDRPDVTRSGMMKIAGTELYKAMTIRNCNTVRKLAALMA
jgi:uncharacterized protein (DUF1697 family)